MFGLSDKVLEWFRSYTWNNAPGECLFMVFYLTFSFCYLVYHRVQFLILWFSQCILILLGLLCSDMGLNITCMLMNTAVYITGSDNKLNFSSSLKNLQHFIADIVIYYHKKHNVNTHYYVCMTWFY